MIEVATGAASGVVNRKAPRPRTLWTAVKQAMNNEGSDPVASGVEEAVLLGRTLLIADEKKQVGAVQCDTAAIASEHVPYPTQSIRETIPVAL